MSDPPISITGPFDKSGDEASGSLQTDLYLTQTSRNTLSVETNRISAFSQGGEDAIQTPLTGDRSLNIDGRANSTLLAEEGLSSSRTDIRTALQKWLFQLESLCVEQQGTGYRIDDTVRDRKYGPRAGSDAANVDGTDINVGFVVSKIRWNVDSTDPLNAEWRIGIEQGQGVTDTESRQSYIDEQVSRASTGVSDEIEVVFDNETNKTLPLGHVESRRLEREMSFKTTETLLQFPDSPQVASPDGGLEINFNVEGTILESQLGSSFGGIAPALQFLEKEIGGKKAVIRDGLTQREFVGTVAESRTTLEAESSAQGEAGFRYDIEFQVGNPKTP